MEKKDLIDILNHLFDHYITGDLEDEQREGIEQGYKEIKAIIEKETQ